MRERKTKSEKLKADEGFTLVELLIYLGLVSLVVTSLILWVLSLAGVRDKNYVVTEVQSNAQMILSVIEREVKQARTIISPLPGASGVTLELARPSPAPNLKFEVIDRSLWLTVVGSPSIKVSSRQVEIANLTFTNLAAPTDGRANVRVSFTVRSRDPASTDFVSGTDLVTAISAR